MAVVIHKYKGKPQSASEKEGRASRRKRDAELTAERIAAVRANRMRSEMLLAKARGELILKELVQKQASYLLVCHRQKLLSMPQAYAPRLLGINDAHEMGLKLREMALALLEDLQNMPEKVTDPHWIESLAEEDGEKPGAAFGARKVRAQAEQKSRKPSSPHPAAPGRRKPAPTN
jgi:hypothetical protein